MEVYIRPRSIQNEVTLASPSVFRELGVSLDSLTSYLIGLNTSLYIEDEETSVPKDLSNLI